MSEEFISEPIINVQWPAIMPQTAPLRAPPATAAEASIPLEPYTTDIRHYVRFDPDGRIRSEGKMAVGYIHDEMYGVNLPGPNYYMLLGEANFDRTIAEYLEWVVEKENGRWVTEPRPVLDKTFDTLTMETYAEATLKDLPPCYAIKFTGPMSGEQPHEEQGDFSIGWTVPGIYILQIRCWPYLPATFTFTVT